MRLILVCLPADFHTATAYMAIGAEWIATIRQANSRLTSGLASCPPSVA